MEEEVSQGIGSQPAVEIDHGDTVVGRIWMCTRTLLQMLQDRGYEVDWQRGMPFYIDLERQLRQLDLADTEKSQRLLNQLRRTVHHPSTGETIEVFWLCGKVGKNSDVVKDITRLLMTTQRAGSTVVLIIQVEGCSISSPAKGELDKCDDSRIEFFDTDFLTSNIVHHRYQPKFELLSDIEAEETKKAYCATSDEIPALLWEDPVRRYLGLKVNQLVRIKRLSDNGFDISYRIVQPKQVGKKK